MLLTLVSQWKAGSSYSDMDKGLVTTCDTTHFQYASWMAVCIKPSGDSLNFLGMSLPKSWKVTTRKSTSPESLHAQRSCDTSVVSVLCECNTQVEWAYCVHVIQVEWAYCVHVILWAYCVHVITYLSLLTMAVLMSLADSADMFHRNWRAGLRDCTGTGELSANQS